MSLGMKDRENPGWGEAEKENRRRKCRPYNTRKGNDKEEKFIPLHILRSRAT